MTLIEIFIIGVSLSCDAFAVAFSKGISINKVLFYHPLIVGFYFGLFQGVMPCLGYIFSSSLSIYLIRYSHLIGFIIIFIIGINMYREETPEGNELLDFKTMLPLAIGTSIDALAVGLTLPFMVESILIPALVIGTTTFILSILAVIFASKIKDKINSSPQKAGGLILILIAIKMLLEFLF